LSYRDLVAMMAMMAERVVIVSRTTIHRWVIQYVSEFEKRWNRFAGHVNTFWRVDAAVGPVRPLLASSQDAPRSDMFQAACPERRPEAAKA
jgi:hypothetical protein